MKNLADYVLVVDDCLSARLCNTLIKKFELSKNHVKREHDWAEDHRSFTEINLTIDPAFKAEQDEFYDITKDLYAFYQKKCGIDFFPEKHGYEEVRMKKYDNKNKDQFGWHTDVSDYASARRYLVMLYYLNNIETGGETAFGYHGSDDYMVVKPKMGRIAIFPPLWMYPHKGMPPISNPKYIISTYAHYL